MNHVLALSKAIAIAAEGHSGMTDLGGEPYILHCIRVMDKVRSLGHQAQVVAILHDYIEDVGGYPREDLIQAIGFESLTILDLLTKKRGEDYLSSYIKRVATNPLATAVKMADLEDNSSILRLKGISKKDFDRMEKYHRAYLYLKGVG